MISIAMAAAIALGDLFAAGEVAFIMALGAILEEMTTKRAKKGLTQLINLAPALGRRAGRRKRRAHTGGANSERRYSAGPSRRDNSGRRPDSLRADFG